MIARPSQTYSSSSPSGGAAAAARAGRPDATLSRLVEHVRTLLGVDGVAFLVVDAERRQKFSGDAQADSVAAPPASRRRRTSRYATPSTSAATTA